MQQGNSQCDRLVEEIPSDLFDLWKQAALRFATRDSLPVVELADRTLTLRWGADVIAADVEDCHYRWGRPWKMKRNSRRARRLLPFGEHDLILIDFPPLQRRFLGGVWSYNTAPVGYTRLSLTQWQTALSAIFHASDRAFPIA